MSINIAIINESGEELELLVDKDDIVNKILPNCKDKKFCCMRFIDSYGDTYFNSLQLPQLKKELEYILAKARDQETRIFLKKLIEIVHKASKEIHTYIKFVGD